MEIDKTGIRFRGTLVCTNPKEKTAPKFVLDELRLFASWSWKAGSGRSSSLEVDMLLFQDCKPDETFEKEVVPENPARLMGALSNTDGLWVLKGGVENLTVSHLASFWKEGGTRDGIMALTNTIKIDHVNVKYSYEKGDKAAG
jgi:hypothetical protein